MELVLLITRLPVLDTWLLLILMFAERLDMWWGHSVKDNICHNPVCEIVSWCECSSWLIKCGSLPIWPTNMAEDTSQETRSWQATSIASCHRTPPLSIFTSLLSNYFSTQMQCKLNLLLIIQSIYLTFQLLSFICTKCNRISEIHSF